MVLCPECGQPMTLVEIEPGDTRWVCELCQSAYCPEDLEAGEPPLELEL